MAAAETNPRTAGALDNAQSEKVATGVSHFLAKVLEQISVSTWLPAVTLVIGLAVMIRLSTMPGPPSLPRAVADLADSPLALLVVLVFAILVVTLALQAFEFEIIRLLEGYYPAVAPLRWLLLDPLTRWNCRKRARLESRVQRLEIAAFLTAREVMVSLPKPIPAMVLALKEQELRGKDLSLRATKADVEFAAALDWEIYAPAHLIHRIDALDARIGHYPQLLHRTMPTRLGNHLRCVEDTLHLDEGETLEGYVLRHHATMSVALQQDFLDCRSRLEMYSSMAVVFVLLAATSVPLLLPDLGAWVSVVVVGLLFLARSAYIAAVASADRLGIVLHEIDKTVRQASIEGATAAPGFLTRIRQRVGRIRT